MGFIAREYVSIAACNRLVMVLVFCAAISAQAATQQDHQGWVGHYALLSDNTYYQGPALKTGATYSFDPPCANDIVGDGYRGTPGEPYHRLTDGGIPWDDGHATLGFDSNVTQSVIFDLKTNYLVGGARIQVRAKPSNVVVTTSLARVGLWVDLAASKFDASWIELKPAKPVLARFVRFDFPPGSYSISEIQVFGGPVEPAKLVEAPGYLVKDGKAAAVIAVPGNPSDQVVRGARELQRVVWKCTGAILPLCEESRVGNRPAVYVGLTRNAAKRGISVPQTYPKGEGYKIVSSGSEVFLVGNDNRLHGSEYACYDFLNLVTGVRWLYPGELGEVVQPKRSLAFPKLKAHVRPQIMFRNPGMYGETNEANVLMTRWFWHNRLSGVPMPRGHSISICLKTENCFKDHPEYFPLVNGQRVSSGNPCTSNPGLIRATAEAITKKFAEEPGLVGWCLMQEDGTPFCECDNCAALDGPTIGSWYGDKGPRLLHFTNAVAEIVREKYPDKFLFTSAYWHSLTAPKEVKGEKNVRALVVFAGCLGHAIDDPKCPTNILYKQIIERWARIAGPVGVFDYAIPSNWKQMIRPQLTAQLRNMRLYKRLGTCGYYIESWQSFASQGPIYWAAARSGWEDPEKLTRDGLWSEWCSQYGPASKQMQGFYKTLEDAIDNATVHHGMGKSWDMPDDQAGIYTRQVLSRAEAKFAAAEKAVESGRSVHKQRLARDRKLWDYTKASIRYLEALGTNVPPEEEAAHKGRLQALGKDAGERAVELYTEGIISYQYYLKFHGGL